MLDNHVKFNGNLFFKNELYKILVVDSKPTKYAIGKSGNVLNLERNKLLRKHKNPDLYVQIIVKNEENCYHFLLHRLVALAFLAKPDEGSTYVNHKDFDRSNNKIENLEWCTQSENELHKQQRMNYENNKIYDELQIKKVCKLLSTNMHSMSQISDMTGVPYSIITKIRRKEYRRDISKNYAIENYVVRRNGSINVDIVEKICQEFENNILSVPEIATKYHISKSNLRSILYRSTYRDISMKYDFSNYNKKDYHVFYSDEKVHQVCKFFEENELTTNEISKITGIPLSYLSEIRRHKKRKDISILYNIDNFNKYFQKDSYSEELLKNIDNLLLKGYRNCEVRDMLKLPKTQKIKSLIANHKNKLKLSN